MLWEAKNQKTAGPVGCECPAMIRLLRTADNGHASSAAAVGDAIGGEQLALIHDNYEALAQSTWKMDQQAPSWTKSQRR